MARRASATMQRTSLMCRWLWQVEQQHNTACFSKYLQASGTACACLGILPCLQRIDANQAEALFSSMMRDTAAFTGTLHCAVWPFTVFACLSCRIVPHSSFVTMPHGRGHAGWLHGYRRETANIFFIAHDPRSKTLHPTCRSVQRQFSTSEPGVPADRQSNSQASTRRCSKRRVPLPRSPFTVLRSLASPARA